MLQIFLVEHFCPLKIKIAQCPSGFRLCLCLIEEKLQYLDRSNVSDAIAKS